MNLIKHRILYIYLIKILSVGVLFFYLSNSEKIIKANESEGQNISTKSKEDISTDTDTSFEKISETPDSSVSVIDNHEVNNNEDAFGVSTEAIGKSARSIRLLDDDLYIIKPVQALTTHLVANNTSATLNLLSQNGLGGQMFGFEWREESGGYIIYTARDKTILFKPNGSTIIKDSSFTKVNNLSRFSDDYIWIIEKEGNNYKIRNKKTNQLFTFANLTSGAGVTLQNPTGNLNQNVLLTSLNGYYTVKGMNASTYALDIKGGVGVGRDIIAFKEHGLLNQQWYFIYVPEIDGTVIGNAAQKTMLISREKGAGGTPITSYFNSAKIDAKFAHYLIPVQTTTNQFQFASRNGQGYIVRAGRITTTGGVMHPLRYDQVNGGTLNDSKWILNKTEVLRTPRLSDFSFITPSKEGSYFVGEVLDYTAIYESSDFSDFDSFVRINNEEYELLEKKIPVSSSKISFKGKIDTLKYLEGSHEIELLTKGEGIFKSNSLAHKINLVYPTPTATPILKEIYKNMSILDLKGTDFVTDVHDEVGNSIQVKLIELDTSVVGDTIAKISLKNQYKEVFLNVPVKIIDKPAVVKVEFVNELNQILSGHTINIDTVFYNTMDLSKENTVVEKINTFESSGYDIVGRPINETAVIIDKELVTVQYKIQGVISLASAPRTIEFGSLTSDATTKRVDNPTVYEKLVVTDTRMNTSTGFKITATLSEPMTNREGKVLANALRYVYKGTEKILGENAQEVYVNSSGVAGNYTVSDSWGTTTGTDGIKLQIGSSDIIYTGDYTGVITWRVIAGQP